jgi:hypothetical protein
LKERITVYKRVSKEGSVFPWKFFLCSLVPLPPPPKISPCFLIPPAYMFPMIFWLCSSGSLVSYKPLGDTHIGTKTTFTPETWPFNIFIHCFASTTAQTFFFQINLRAKSTYQQSPKTPCMISDGLGLRKTSHGSCD